MVFEPISGTIGAAGFAFQVFEGVKRGYEYFVDAAHMPADCASLQLRLLFEYTRLLDWGDAAGLSEPRHHGSFDVKLRANRPMILAALSEMETRLSTLTKIKGEYREFGEAEQAAIRREGDSNVASGSQRAATIRQHIDVRQREEMSSTDLAGSLTLFESQDSAKEEQSRGAKIFARFKRSAENMKNVVTHPKRIWWAVADKEKFKGHLAKLKELTDFLHEMLGDAKVDALLKSSRETCLAMIQLNGHVAELKVLLTAARLRAPTQSDISDDASFRSDATTLVDGVTGNGIPSPISGSSTSFEQLTRFRLHHAEIYNRSRRTEDIRINFELLKFKSTQIQSQRSIADISTAHATVSGSLAAAATETRRAWVEWKEYEEVNLGVASDGFTLIQGPAQNVRTRVEQLVMLLKEDDQPSEFRIPHCIGYCQDSENTRFGFVYELPVDSDGPKTLYDLLLNHRASLASRIETAKHLAASMLMLHTVGWLHKDFRSANVLFLSGKLLPDLPGLSLGGFEYARPDHNDLTTTQTADEAEVNMYRHPEYQGTKPLKGFRKSYDIYSLGIVLVELAYWKRIGDILADGSTAATAGRAASAEGLLSPLARGTTNNAASAGHEVRDSILTEPSVLENVRIAMGERYCGAVEACIKGIEGFGLPHGADETDPMVATVLQLAYLRLVVDPLRGIHV